MEARISIITIAVDDLQRSYDFYHGGLKFPNTSWGPDKGIVFLNTTGTKIALYPASDMQKEAPHGHLSDKRPYLNFTFAHNVQDKAEVDAILKQAKEAGGVIEMPAADQFWGGYSGKFSDPDGYLWEVAYSENNVFDDHGHLIIE